MYCQNCGKEMEEKWTVCPYCGNSIKELILEENQEEKSLKRKKGKISKGILFGVVILVIVTLGLGLKENDNKTKEVNTEKHSSKNETKEEDSVQLSYDIYADVEDGLLYANSKGEITNKKGKVIEEYSSYTVTENGYISDGEVCLEGLYVDENKKLCVWDLEDIEVVYDTPLEKLREKAYPEGCATGIIIDEYWEEKGLDYKDLATEVEDDGSYFDEVVLGAWFDEVGTPIAGGLPNKLALAVAEYTIDTSGFQVSGFIKDFLFIDGETFSMDILKRKSPDESALYALVVTDISKYTNSNGEPYFAGSDYISKATVVIHGNFSGILNGDNLLVFGDYTGLASDDTPNFRGIWIENINNRGID